MNNKRITALILCAFMIFSLTACRDKDTADGPQESPTNSVSENASDSTADVDVSDVADSDTTVLSTDVSDTSTSTEAESAAASPTLSNNPAEWSKAQIVDAYKNAAKKSNAAAKSAQTITLKSISVNNGQYKGLFEFITPIMSKLLANNSTEKDGITGGYRNLVEADISNAKAYKSGNNVAIEMTMREQVSGPCDDALSGSVGHAITAVGDISIVVKQLTDLGLPLELSEKDTKIYYTNPVVKVLINSNGEIISGTWRYTVEIRMDNYKAFGKEVQTTSVIMDNTVTVNDGFKK